MYRNYEMQIGDLTDEVEQLEDDIIKIRKELAAYKRNKLLQEREINRLQITINKLLKGASDAY